MSNYYWIVLQTSWFWRGNSWPLRKDFPKYTKLNRPHLFLWMRHCTYHSIIQMQMIMNTIGFCFVSLLFHTPLHKGPVVLEACPSFCFQFTQCRENAKIDLFLTLALYVFVIRYHNEFWHNIECIGVTGRRVRHECDALKNLHPLNSVKTPAICLISYAHCEAMPT